MIKNQLIINQTLTLYVLLFHIPKQHNYFIRFHIDIPAFTLYFVIRALYIYIKN